MTRLRRSLAVALLGSGLLAGPLAAQLPEMPMGKWWVRPRVVQILGISAEQQEKLDGIFSRNRRSFIELKADVERRQLDLEELMGRKESDAKRVTEAVDALEQARMKLARQRTLMFVDMKAVLTAEQWQRIQERREDWRAERLDDRRRMRGGLPPRGERAPKGDETP